MFFPLLIFTTPLGRLAKDKCLSQRCEISLLAAWRFEPGALKSLIQHSDYCTTLVFEPNDLWIIPSPSTCLFNTDTDKDLCGDNCWC